ncbi:MAG: DUF6502 family protein [Rhodoferax sp.]
MKPRTGRATNPPDSTALSGASLPEPGMALQAIAQVARPLARLMIDHGVQLPSMVELLKQALVDQASTAYGLADKGSSDTRIAVLTGVHRKDVRRLRAVLTPAQAGSPMLSLSASVVARWISEPRFLNADQSARVLARTPTRAIQGEPDFTTLVAEVSRDVGARAVLDELARLGAVQVRDDGYVELKATAFVPRQGVEESFHFPAANVSEHLAAAAHNLAPRRKGSPKLEQSAFSQDLSAEQAEQLHVLARKLWAIALPQFLQMATVAEQRSQADVGPKYKVRFGVYFNDAEQLENTSVGKAAKAPRTPSKKGKTKP